MTVGALAARPFYHEFAWAYDLLVPRPVVDECAGMAAWLARRGVRPGAAVLDAGCGTGRYAVELARRGFVVTAVDRSPELLAEAAARARAADRPITLAEADLGALPAGPLYDAVVCRGVLNDVLGAGARAAVLDGFARVLRPGGIVVLDVRDWDLTVARKTAEPVTDKRVVTPRGPLAFRSVTRLDPATRRLLVSERHALTTPSGERVATHELVMQCWTRAELAAGLAAAGFDAVEYATAYPGTAGRGLEDRIVASASCRRE
ncbi:MAG TPA: class I SAM-dependent methyltransferase [Verrucomicrobiae bacterium]|jgi:SAM-dependent methyltransferase|nr:class I SAM-dependent methyltransferase [Verrucomicrobiae bacterium]